MDLIPLEDDLLSLELNGNFAHYMLQDDDAYKVYVKDSINRIEAVFGSIKYKFAKGTDSCQILRRLKETAPIADAGAGGNGPESEIDCLLMIDREVDLVSPFCVNQTYEGLLDEFFRIRTCSVTVDTEIVTPDAQKDPKSKVVDPVQVLTLTNEDETFKDVRDKHFNTLEKIFSQKCRDIQNVVKEKDAP